MAPTRSREARSQQLQQQRHTRTINITFLLPLIGWEGLGSDGVGWERRGVGLEGTLRQKNSTTGNTNHGSNRTSVKYSSKPKQTDLRTSLPRPLPWRGFGGQLLPVVSEATTSSMCSRALLCNPTQHNSASDSSSSEVRLTQTKQSSSRTV